MRVMVIGQGGREHALCWKLSQSPRLTKLYCAPGNPGISEIAELAPIAVDDIERLISFVREEKIDFTIVGPELPLSLGLVDRLRAIGARVFGPTEAAAEIEASKSFSKEIMAEAGVLTAESVTINSKAEALEQLDRLGCPLVFKADGLAAGKGVFVCHDCDQAAYAIESLFSEDRSQRVVVEQFLEGKEASLIVATDGQRVVPMVPSNDYKRIGDGDSGLNTGGMGTVSPTQHLSETQFKHAIDTVITPVLRVMAKRGIPFSGFLYAGLMIGNQGEVNCLEFNARLGDPETQVILRRLESDLLLLLFALSDDTGMEVDEPIWNADIAICVVHAADGYPMECKKGDVITGIREANQLEGVVVFHAGTALTKEGTLVSAGGRVLNITASAPTLVEARRRAYQASEIVSFRGRQYRRDIGEG